MRLTRVPERRNDQGGPILLIAVVAIVIIAAIITPTPDPFTQMSVAIPLYALYEIGVVLARVAAPEDEDSPEDSVSTETGAR